MSKKKPTNEENRIKGQRAVDLMNYKAAKKEVLSGGKGTKPIIGEDMKQKLKRKEQIGKRIGVKPKDVVKVSSSNHGRMKAHAYKDKSTGKTTEAKPKFVVEGPKKRAEKAAKKVETFKQEGNALTRDKKKREAARLKGRKLEKAKTVEKNKAKPAERLKAKKVETRKVATKAKATAETKKLTKGLNKDLGTKKKTEKAIQTKRTELKAAKKRELKPKTSPSKPGNRKKRF